MITIYLIPTGKRSPERTETYEIELDGIVIGEHRDPEFHACRLLKERGLSGKVCFFRRGLPTPDCILDIEKGAGLMTSDDRKNGPRIVKYQDPSEAFNKMKSEKANGE